MQAANKHMTHTRAIEWNLFCLRT